MIDPFHKEPCKIFNEEKYIEHTAVTCIRWVPYSTKQFLVAHASGHMYLYSEELPCCPTPPVYQLFKRGPSYVVYTCKTKSTCNPLYNWALTNILADSVQSKISEDCDVSTAPLSSINQFSFSTCGKYLAVVSEDGYLRVFDYHQMQLYGFMRSYFGGLTCVDWSPDGKYVVVGGQDDLITIWSFSAQAVICRGQGHKSWTSVVRFDPFAYPPSLCNGTAVMRDLATSLDRLSLNGGPHQYHSSPSTDSDSAFRTYRLGSVGQDTFLCLWELTEDVIRQGLRFSSHFHQSTGNGRQNLGGLPTFSASNFTSACADGSMDGLEKIRSIPRNSGGGGGVKRKPFLSSFRSSLPLTSRHLEQSDASGKSSVVSDNCCHSALGDKGPADGVNGNNLSSVLSRDLLGTPICPRLSDVPILEPFAKFGITSDLITDLVFREDSINLAFQQGVILTYTRPQMESCSAAVAAGDLSIFDTSHLVDDSGAVEVDDDDVDVDEGGVDVHCVEVVDDVNDDVEVSPAHIRGSLSNASATSSTIATPTNSNHHLRHHALSPGLQHRLSRSPFVPESAGQALR
ncbi:WD repeat containing protein 20 [Echinococcus multilocularis]|uniref:WD repeat containing protein 20 n=1 Tax=Echinococcus multilocularis TaxID=6211 RepID=A0A068XXG7_ECHMU|nr:WD repeat containing protein 20 [Echinococcus multilocularis]